MMDLVPSCNTYLHEHSWHDILTHSLTLGRPPRRASSRRALLITTPKVLLIALNP